MLCMSHISFYMISAMGSMITIGTKTRCAAVSTYQLEPLEETFRHCVAGHGLVRNIDDMRVVGVNDLRDLFQLWWFCDSMIRRNTVCISN